MKNTTFVVVLLWLIGVAMPGLAQVDTGTVVGTIKDSTGAVVPGATAAATEMDTGTKATVKSDSDGNFVISSLRRSRLADTPLRSRQADSNERCARTSCWMCSRPSGWTLLLRSVRLQKRRRSAELLHCWKRRVRPWAMLSPATRWRSYP